MRKHYDEQLVELRESLIKMGAMVEELLDLSIKALINRDLDLADKVINKDEDIDEMEIDIEKKCLELIALQQPLAKDLRMISTILKMITDLERIGDHCVNIALVVRKIGDEDFIKPLVDIPKMAELVKKMIKGSLDSFCSENVILAVETAKIDDKLDEIYEGIYIELLDMLTQKKEIMNQVVNLLFIGRYLERIGDHITNICERIVFMVDGQRVSY